MLWLVCLLCVTLLQAAGAAAGGVAVLRWWWWRWVVGGVGGWGEAVGSGACFIIHPLLLARCQGVLLPFDMPSCVQLPSSSPRQPEPALPLPLRPLPALAPSRFGSQLLGLAPDEPLPSLQQLEAALLGEAAPPPAPAPAPDAMAVDGEGGAAAEEGDGSPPPDAAVKLQMALADFLAAGLFQDTAAAIVGELAMREGCGQRV